MKRKRPFAAERAVAMHCPELLKRGPTSADLLAQFAHAGEKMVRLLGDRFAPLGDRGDGPTMRCLPVQEIDADGLAGMIGPLAGNCLLAAAGTDPILVSFQAEGVFHLLDRSFGGPGEVPSPLPDAFPYSAELMMHRLEGTAASTLTTALGVEITPKARSSHFSDLTPFAKDSRLAILQIEATQRSGMSWTVTIATTLAALEAFFDQGERRALSRTAPHSATGEPFADLPLTVSAILVDMRMAVSALSEIRPGQVLPVSVARSVPLRIGEATIAHGTIGALDDRVAVQITQAF
jgi:flagellar motor switch protein FliM